MSTAFPRRPTAPVHLDCRHADTDATLAELDRASTALSGRRLTVSVATRAPGFATALETWLDRRGAQLVAHSCKEGEHYAIVVFIPEHSVQQTLRDHGMDETVPTRDIGVPERIRIAMHDASKHWRRQRPTPAPSNAGERVAYRVQGMFAVADPDVEHHETADIDEKTLEAALEASERDNVMVLDEWRQLLRKAS